MEDRLAILTTLAYGAALDDEKWDAFLQACSDLVGGGVRTCLFGYDADARIELGARQFGYDPAYQLSYAAYYSQKDFLAARLMEEGPGRVVPYGEVWNDFGLRNTEFYDDWVRPQEDIIGGCSVLLFKQEKRLFAFSGSIRSRDSDQLERPWQRIVTYLTPHLRQAFEVARALAGAELEKKAMVNVQNPARTGCLVVSRDRRIVFANRQAENMLDSGELVRSDFRQRLLFADPTWDQRLGQILASRILTTPQTLRLLNDLPTPFICRIAPLGSDDLGTRSSGMLFGREEPCFLLTISQEHDVPDIGERLRNRFGLTPHEAQVVLHVSSGLLAKEISEIRGTSVHTVRNQIHNAMSKMEVRRQSEIVRIVAAMRNPLLQ
ncbi:helix-turn-helix transcriptional regulator [Nitratireductor aquibiodomus]|uniref:helix-turn-helix transcriptional regulator n=1 Tax=Nitratireductor aquibiodomus TaxID=204799 RepID=UPI000469A187|nr:PAS and helix-turn-helix domain-containing protein [Nitratireductor aquibiodomus]